MNPELITAIIETIANAQQILVVTHISPDGDALGSLTAMGIALQRLGKEVILACDDGMIDRYNYLPLADQVVRRPDPDKTYDLLIALDCGDVHRMGKAYGRLKTNPSILNIDHHVSNTMFGHVNLVVSDASSTTEILTDLFPAIGVPLDAELAASLMTGLVTDTLCFRTTNVNGHTLQVASQLVDAGADLAGITEKALIVQPMTTLQMWRTGLNNMHIEDGVAWTTLSQKDQRLISKDAVNSQGLGNMIANVIEVDMSAVFTEKDDGRITVGFRSRPPYDVAELATRLGGGGHKHAAGCTVHTSLEEAVTLVIGEAKAHIDAQRTVINHY